MRSQVDETVYDFSQKQSNVSFYRTSSNLVHCALRPILVAVSCLGFQYSHVLETSTIIPVKLAILCHVSLFISFSHEYYASWLIYYHKTSIKSPTETGLKAYVLWRHTKLFSFSCTRGVMIFQRIGWISLPSALPNWEGLKQTEPTYSLWNNNEILCIREILFHSSIPIIKLV